MHVNPHAPTAPASAAAGAHVGVAFTTAVVQTFPQVLQLLGSVVGSTQAPPDSPVQTIGALAGQDATQE